jgi:hypothetical protein
MSHRIDAEPSSQVTMLEQIITSDLPLDLKAFDHGLVTTTSSQCPA